MASPLYDIPLRRIDGKEATLGEYSGDVLMIVNVASQCGKTPQYAGLEKLHANYRDRGFAVLGFPANDFGAQEPGTNEEIQEFCRTVYGVDFPMFAKIAVTGTEKHPLYRYLTQSMPKAEFPAGMTEKPRAAAEQAEIHWNFEKFLIRRDGRIAARFAPDMPPEDPRIVSTIEAELDTLR
jgi:glutathione peroxidase